MNKTIKKLIFSIMLCFCIQVAYSQQRGEEKVVFDFVDCPKITHTTVAKVPKDRGRLTIGAGEELDLEIMGTFTSVNWSISDVNKGKIVDKKSNKAKFKANLYSGTVVVYVETIPSCTVNPKDSIIVNIVEPERVKNYLKVGGKHTMDSLDIGVCTEMSVLPDFVNFYNLEFLELDTVGIGSGFISKGIPTHMPSMKWIPTYNNSISAGNGTLINTYYIDYAYVIAQYKPSLKPYGSVNFNIPSIYRIKGTSITKRVNLLTKQTHSFVGPSTFPGTKGNYAIVKKDCINEAFFIDPTTTCP